MGNIILICVCAFIAIMIFVGLKMGLIKMAFSIGSVIIVLILVNILTPTAKELLKNTPMYDSIHESIQTYAKEHVESATEDMTQTGVKAQKKIIEDLSLPKSVKNTLVEKNNKDNYKSLKVDSFTAYLTEALSDMVLNALTFVILFLVLMVLVKVIVIVLDIVAKLPVIHFFNSAGGALLGMAEAVIIIWIGCMIVTMFSATDWGMKVMKAISENVFLTFIYDNNVIQKIITGIFGF